MGVDAEPLAGAADVEVERDALGQLLGAVGQLALEGGVAVELLLPRGERLLPGLVVREEPRQVPGVGHLDLAAERQLS